MTYKNVRNCKENRTTQNGLAVMIDISNEEL